MHWRTITRLLLLAAGLTSSGLIPSMAGATLSALADAEEQHDRAAVRTLLRTGADVNASQPDGNTALLWAAYNDDLEITGVLLKAGAHVNAANRYGVTPLAQACTNGNAGIVKLLLDAGADINTTLKG